MLYAANRSKEIYNCLQSSRTFISRVLSTFVLYGIIISIIAIIIVPLMMIMLGILETGKFSYMVASGQESSLNGMVVYGK